MTQLVFYHMGLGQGKQITYRVLHAELRKCEIFPRYNWNWLNSIKEAPTLKAIRLLVERISVAQNGKKIDLRAASTLRPIQKMVVGEGALSLIFSLCPHKELFFQIGSSFDQPIRRASRLGTVSDSYRREARWVYNKVYRLMREGEKPWR